MATMYFMTAETNGSSHVNAYSPTEAIGVYGEQDFRRMTEGGEAVMTEPMALTVCMNTLASDRLADALNEHGM